MDTPFLCAFEHNNYLFQNVLVCINELSTTVIFRAFVQQFGGFFVVKTMSQAVWNLWLFVLFFNLKKKKYVTWSKVKRIALPTPTTYISSAAQCSFWPFALIHYCWKKKTHFFFLHHASISLDVINSHMTTFFLQNCTQCPTSLTYSEY